MRKLTIIAMSLFAAAVLTACGAGKVVEITDTASVGTEYAASAPSETAASESSAPDLGDVYGENWIWKWYDSREEAEAAVGITLEAPLFGKEEYATYLSNKGQESIRIWYLNVVEEGNSVRTEEIIVRKQHHGVKPEGSIPIPEGSIPIEEREAERDTSREKTIRVNGNDVVLTMDGDNVASADWSVGIYDYALEIKGMDFTAEDAADYIAQVK